MSYRVLVSILLFGAAVVVPSGCTRNAVTGESSLLFLSKDEEKQMGAEAEPQFIEQFGGRVPNQQCQEYVSRIGHKLAALTEEDFPSFPWDFNLLNSDVINAFALPGGKVFITRGLAAKLTSEAQLAGVLGHEIGHVTARHSNQQISKSQILSGGLKAAEVVVGVAGSDGGTISTVGQYGIPALQTGGQVLLLSYGRKDESQADELGMRYMAKAGYNPAAQMQVMEILQQVSGGGGGQPEWLSTHPFPETRIEQIKQLLATRYKDTQNNPQYGTYEKEYRDGFLSILSKLPPAPKPKEEPGGAAQGLQNSPSKKQQKR